MLLFDLIFDWAELVRKAWEVKEKGGNSGQKDPAESCVMIGGQVHQAGLEIAREINWEVPHTRLWASSQLSKSQLFMPSKSIIVSCICTC
jgi:hypothetical protein